MVKNIFKKANWIWCESEGQADEYGEFYSSFNYDGEKNVKLNELVKDKFSSRIEI